MNGHTPPPGSASSGPGRTPTTPAGSATPSASRPAFQHVNPTATASESAGASVSEKRWSAMQADLHARGIDGSSMELVSARDVTWTSGALGCPRPGRQYTQEVVAGQQVVVAVGSTHYDYRFGRTDSPLLCQR